MNYNKLISEFDRLINSEQFELAGKILEDSKTTIDCIDKDFLLAINNELIGFYRKQNDKIRCLSTINETLTILNAIKNKKTEFYGTIYLNIATGYSAFNCIQQAEENFIKSELIFQDVLDVYDSKLGALYNNFASIYLLKNEPLKARDYYQKSILLAEKNNNKLYKAQSLVNITYTYNIVNDDKIIEELLDNANKLFFDNDIIKDKETSFIYKKYAKDFAYYGYFLVEEELLNRAKEIDERY